MINSSPEFSNPEAKERKLFKSLKNSIKILYFAEVDTNKGIARTLKNENRDVLRHF